MLPLPRTYQQFRSNTFLRVDPDFVPRAKDWGGGIIVGGSNYGQGSSREHAALAPMYLGVRAVIAKSFARIHLANLINNGILPLAFSTPSDYDTLDLGDELVLADVHGALQEGRPWSSKIEPRDSSTPSPTVQQPRTRLPPRRGLPTTPAHRG